MNDSIIERELTMDSAVMIIKYREKKCSKKSVDKEILSLFSCFE